MGEAHDSLDALWLAIEISKMLRDLGERIQDYEPGASRTVAAPFDWRFQIAKHEARIERNHRVLSHNEEIVAATWVHQLRVRAFLDGLAARQSSPW